LLEDQVEKIGFPFRFIGKAQIVILRVVIPGLAFVLDIAAAGRFSDFPLRLRRMGRVPGGSGQDGLLAMQEGGRS
jgi:hypothetical protein